MIESGHGWRDSSIRGALLGLAAGDLIGGPTQMALCLAMSLLRRRCFDPQDILDQYLHWFEASGFDTGPVASQVFSRVLAGSCVDEAVCEVDRLKRGLTAGCNPMHRSVSLALVPFISSSELVDLSAREARLTHRHALAGASSGLFLKIVRGLIIGEDWDRVLIDVFEADDLRDFRRVRDKSRLSRSGFAPRVLEAAVYLVDSTDSFSAALRQSIDFAGAENYSPVVVGALAGARYGEDAISGELLAHCPNSGEIRSCARQLAELW